MDDSVHVLGHHSGWLWKWTNYVRGHQKRWFVLSGGVLSYYLSHDEISSGCRGQIVLNSASIVRENSFDFRVQIGNAFGYYLRASEEADCQKWMKALKKAQTVSENEDAQANLIQLEHNRQSNEEKIRKLIEPVKSKLDELKSHNTVTEKHSASLLTALAEFENAKKQFETQDADTDSSKDHEVVKLKELNETVMLFRITSSAMVERCTEFLELMKKQSNEFQSVFYQEKMQELQTIGPSDFASSSEDEDNFEDAIEIPSCFTDDREDQARTDPGSFGQVASDTSRDWVYRKHRSTIPHKPNYRLNLWQILKNCIGRDISKLPIPVNFNEPISILQRLTEGFEYSQLLDEAARCTDSCLQMAYVVAFSVSEHSTTSDRTGKPFNPMLGETFEYDSADEFGFRLIAEQVSHHPPKAALHVESTNKDEHGGWSYWYDVSPTSKFRGYSLTLTPIGTCHLKFHSSGNHYTWKKVSLTVSNIIIGKLWFDQWGESNFKNHSTGDVCNFVFHPYEYLGSNAFQKVSGDIFDKYGVLRYSLCGSWNESLKCKKIDSQINTAEEEVTIWKVNPLPPLAEKMYFFTKFTMLLNEWVDATAPTDSRRRPDQRKMEETLWDDANNIKLELEERQRQRRRNKEKQDEKRREQGLPPVAYKPRWFEMAKCPVTGEKAYVYRNEYWEAKERQDWTGCENIYDLSGDKRASSSKENWPDLVKSTRITD